MINWSNQPGQVFPNNQAGVGSQYDRPTPPAPMHVALAPAHVTPAGPVGSEAVPNAQMPIPRRCNWCCWVAGMASLRTRRSQVKRQSTYAQNRQRF